MPAPMGVVVAGSDVVVAFRGNRRRVRRVRGRWLQRQRSEKVERSFAHVCRSGGARRTWLWGLEKTNKRYLVTLMAHNLGLVMRKLFGIGKPREWAAACAAFLACLLALRQLRAILQRAFQLITSLAPGWLQAAPGVGVNRLLHRAANSSVGTTTQSRFVARPRKRTVVKP